MKSRIEYLIIAFLAIAAMYLFVEPLVLKTSTQTMDFAYIKATVSVQGDRYEVTFLEERDYNGLKQYVVRNYSCKSLDIVVDAGKDRRYDDCAYYYVGSGRMYDHWITIHVHDSNDITLK